MKRVFCLLIIAVSVFAAQAEQPCTTVEGIVYECGNNTDKLRKILEVLRPHSAMVYKFDKDNLDSDLNYTRYVTQFKKEGEAPVDSYFQDYIINYTKNYYHIYHFVKNEDGQFDVFSDRELELTSEGPPSDMRIVSDHPKLLGTTTEFDSDNSDGLVLDHKLHSNLSRYHVATQKDGVFKIVIRDGGVNGSIWYESESRFIYSTLFE